MGSNRQGPEQLALFNPDEIEQPPISGKDALIAHINDTIATVQASHPRGKRKTEFIRNLKAIRDGLKDGDAEAANRGVDRLLRQIEDSGGILKTQEIGPHGSPETVIYTSEAAKMNHRFVLQLLHDVRSVTEMQCNAPYCPSCWTPVNR